MLNFEIVLLLSFIIALQQSTANAQSPSNYELDEISVIGTKTEKLTDEAPDKGWGALLNIIFAAEKKQREISATTRQPIDGYTVVDLLGYTTVKENFSLSFGLFNIFDKQYLRWADTAFIQTGSAFQRYTQPGFHGGINLKYTM